jgi:TrkA-N domain
MRIAQELRTAGMPVVTLQSSHELADLGLADAAAVVCAADDDAQDLRIALLLTRQLKPTVRVVARLANSVLRDAVALGNGPWPRCARAPAPNLNSCSKIFDLAHDLSFGSLER